MPTIVTMATIATMLLKRNAAQPRMLYMPFCALCVVRTGMIIGA